MVGLLLTAYAEAGQACKVSMMPWRRAVGAAEAGEVDGIFPVADSLERRAGFELSHGLALLNDIAARHQLPEANQKDLQAIGLVKEFDYVYAVVPSRSPPGFALEAIPAHQHSRP